MTESEWLSCRDASTMVETMIWRSSGRKFRLFGVACCRLLGRVPDCPEFFQALEASEQFADGKPNKSALRRARRAVRLVRVFNPPDRGRAEDWVALWLAEVAASEEAVRGVARQIDQFIWRGPLTEAGRPPGPALARCIFGNPYRHQESRVEGLSSSILDMARAIYDDRAFDQLPILGDALEESGSIDADLLAHCREDRVHAKGCWVLDFILGRS